MLNKQNDEWITIQFTKGKISSTQPCKPKNFMSTKEKLEKLGYTDKKL